MKTKSLLFLFVLFFINVSYSQDFDIEWSELKKGSKGLTIATSSVGEGDYFSVSVYGDYIQSYQISYFEKFNLVSSDKVPAKIDGERINYEGAEFFGDKYLVILSTKTKNETIFYGIKYDKDITGNEEPVELGRHSAVNGPFNQSISKFSGNSWIQFSKSREYMAIKWDLMGEDKKSNGFGVKIYDVNLKEVRQVDHKLPFKDELIEIDNYHLTNDAEFFIIVKEYNEPEKKKRYFAPEDYEATHVFQVSETKLKSYTVEMDGKRLGGTAISSSNTEYLNIIGTYGDVDVEGLNGIFSMKLDFKNQKVLNEEFNELKYFLLNPECDGEECDKDLMITSCELDQGLVILDDGKILGSLEHRYVVRKTYKTSDGSTAVKYINHADNVYPFCIDSKGEIEWFKAIRKKQEGSAIGNSSFLNGENLVFIFNDNKENYNSKGNYELENGKLERARWQKKYATVAIAEVDISSGEIDRRTMFDREEVEAYAYPELFNVDYIRDEVMLVFKLRSKNKFGLLKLDNE